MADSRANRNGVVARIFARPRPPAYMVEMPAGRFVPAPELTEWISSAWLDETGPLFDEEHEHLAAAHIGCIWTDAENTRQQRRIVGQAELPSGSLARMGKWQKGRAFQQLEEWFGSVPDFLLTFDAAHAADVDDATFCALIAHELCHCAQDVDEYGQPKFGRDGRPKFAIRGHDVEEFVSVVRRFGVDAAGEQARAFVDAASRKPEVAPVRLAQACGTCIARAA